MKWIDMSYSVMRLLRFRSGTKLLTKTHDLGILMPCMTTSKVDLENIC